MGTREPVVSHTFAPIAIAASLCLAVVALDGCKIEERPQPSHRGVYIGGGELNSFIPCGSDSLLWVAGRSKSALQARYNALARHSLQPIYVELKAQRVPSSGAPKEGHRGTIRVDTVLTATTQVPLECRPKVLPGSEATG